MTPIPPANADPYTYGLDPAEQRRLNREALERMGRSSLAPERGAICTIEGCVRAVHGRGLCGSHHQRWLRTGDPQADKPLRQRFGELLERLEENLLIGDGCWTWLGGYNGRGRARMTVEPNRMAYVYRVLYELLIGPIPEGLQLDHLCGDRSCVNPAHLEPVEPAENRARYWARRAA